MLKDDDLTLEVSIWSVSKVSGTLSGVYKFDLLLYIYIFVWMYVWQNTCAGMY